MSKEEGNRLIAEFIGGKISLVELEGYPSIACFFFDEREDNPFPFNSLKYHSSWDWLMPVVEKIEENYEVNINNCFCEIILNDGEGTATGIIKKDADTKIEAVWQAVISFLQWYNNQKSTNNE